MTGDIESIIAVSALSHVTVEWDSKFPTLHFLFDGNRASTATASKAEAKGKGCHSCGFCAFYNTKSVRKPAVNITVCRD
jgi:hypothetical protein